MSRDNGKMTHAESGQIGARKRWGPPRVVRLDDLTTDQRYQVLELVTAMNERRRYMAAARNKEGQE